MQNKEELERAQYIYKEVEDIHDVLDSLYENLVDRDMNAASVDVRYLLFRLKDIESKIVSNEI